MKRAEVIVEKLVLSTVHNPIALVKTALMMVRRSLSTVLVFLDVMGAACPFFLAQRSSLKSMTPI
jgi:hypothetical protein